MAVDNWECESCDVPGAFHGSADVLGARSGSNTARGGVYRRLDRWHGFAVRFATSNICKMAFIEH